MEQVFERRIFELPVDLRIDFFNKLEKLFKQEDDTMNGLIDRTRKSLHMTMNDFKQESNKKNEDAVSASRQETLRVADSAKNPPTPLHLFDKDHGDNKENMEKNKEAGDFKEERDEIMSRMTSEQKKLEVEKEKQAAILKNKMSKMASKQQETEVKADEMMKEANKLEEMQRSERDMQANKLKEKLEEKAKNKDD